MAGLGNFYGADWIGMAGNLLGLWYISQTTKAGIFVGHDWLHGVDCFWDFDGKCPERFIERALYRNQFSGLVQMEEETASKPGKHISSSSEVSPKVLMALLRAVWP